MTSYSDGDDGNNEKIDLRGLGLYLLVFVVSIVIGTTLAFVSLSDMDFYSILFKYPPLHYFDNSTNPHSEKERKTKQGKWFKLPSQDKNSNIQGLGYLAGYQKSKFKNVTQYDTSKAYNGLNFYVSGHAPEAKLIDMKGNVVHRWKFPWKKAFPKIKRNIHLIKGFPGKDQKAGNYWNFAYLYPNGDILAIYEEMGLIKLNKDSELLWAQPIKAHHDIWVSPDGKIYTLTLKRTKLKSFRFSPTYRNQVGFSDYITVLTPGGDIIKEYSILEAMDNSKFAPMLKFVHNPDIFHTNTVQILTDLPNGMPEEFQGGRVLIAMRRLNFTGLIDLDSNKMVWGKNTRVQGQHDPSVLPNGNLLVYDNRRRGNYSRIVELDPESWTVQWELSGNKDVRFYSLCCGRNQLLPNGNILVTVTTEGRAFEVTRNKEIVWEYFNPHRLKAKNNYIAAMYNLKRYQKDYFENWIEDKLQNRKE